MKFKLVDHLTDNYQKDPASNNAKLLGMVDVGLEELQRVFSDIEASRDIDRAEGVILDKLGKNVLEYRNEKNDEIYRDYIKIKIRANLSKGDIETINEVAEFFLGDNFIAVQELWNDESYNKEPAAIAIKLKLYDGNLPKVIKQVAAGGVRVYWRIQVPKAIITIIAKQSQLIQVALKSRNNFWTPFNTQPLFNGTAFFDGAYLFSGNRYGPKHLILMRRKMFNDVLNEINNTIAITANINATSTVSPDHAHLVRVYLFARPSRAANFSGLTKFDGATDFNNLFIEHSVAFCKRLPIVSRPEIKQKTAFQVGLTSSNQQSISHATGMRKAMPAASGRAANFSGRLRFDGVSNFDRTLTRQPAALRAYQNDVLVEEVAV